MVDWGNGQGSTLTVWQPSAEDIRRILDEQNPWHREGKVPEVLAPAIERGLVEPLYQRLVSDRPRRFQVVLGHRRVGKTTAMYHVVARLLRAGVPARRLWWHRLDHPVFMEASLDSLLRATLDAAEATVESPAYVFLDEVVYAHDWDLWLKTFYDEHWPIRVVATSSATAALRDRRTESGVGRWEEQHLTPYLLSEYLALRGEPRPQPLGATLAETLERAVVGEVDLADVARRRRELMLVGGFPELLSAHEGHPHDEHSAVLESQRTLHSDAIERAVYKDIPQSFGIDSPLTLERVLYMLAGQMGGLLSPTSIARDLGIAQPTLDRYIGHLEQTFIVFTLPNYSGQERAVQRRGRKLYFVDSAVRNAALQRGTAPLDDDTEMGLLRENLAAAHLKALAAQTQARLYHWRAGRDEVDLVYDHPQQPLAFEVASSPGHHRHGLRAFAEQHPRFAGGCYLVSPSAPLTPASSERIGSLPFDLYLLLVSQQAERALHEHLGTGLGNAGEPQLPWS